MGLMEDISKQKAWQIGPGVSEGEDLEAGLLGVPKLLPSERRQEYMAFDAAVEFVKQRQPDKRTEFAKKLRQAVADQCSDIREPVRYFTAVGTPLDVYHGVDAFFEQNGTIVTLDVSGRDKDSRYKADVLIIGILNEEGVPKAAPGEMETASTMIARLLDKKRVRKAA